MSYNLQIIYSKNTDEIFNRQSALGSYINCLAGILAENGYVVRINEIELDKLQVKKTGSIINIKKSFVKKIVPSFVKEYIKDKKLLRSIDELFFKIDNGFSFDIILEFYTYGSDIGYRLSEKYNKPLVLVYDNPVLEEHAFFYPGQFFFKKWISKREEKTLFKASSIVVYSDAVEKYLTSRFRKKFSFFIHQNVDYTRFEYIENKSMSEPINIGFIGSFLKWHSVDILLNAFTRLKDEGKNVRLFLIGNGMDYDRIKELVALNPYYESIEMPGFIDGVELMKYKELLHIGVMPGSNWYGAPNKIFEYGAAKMAVVAPDTPTIKSLFIDEKELLLFKQGKDEDLYGKLFFLIDNTQLLQGLAAALQKKVSQSYSEQITFEFYNSIFKKNL